MAGPADIPTLPPRPTLLPLGDAAILVHFAASLNDAANRAAIACARQLADEPLPGVLEVVPNLVSVLLRYDPYATALSSLLGELRLRLFVPQPPAEQGAQARTIMTRFGGEDGPDIDFVAESLGHTAADFIAAHNAAPLRVLATGFAPGFVYCGFHPPALALPRRNTVRASVPPGSVLFAAGQTAITATTVPTGWHVIGRTGFANFDATNMPPTKLCAGDQLQFAAMP